MTALEMLKKLHDIHIDVAVLRGHTKYATPVDHAFDDLKRAIVGVIEEVEVLVDTISD